MDFEKSTKFLFFSYVIAGCCLYCEALSNISVSEAASAALLSAVNANNPTAVRDAIESGANVTLANGAGFTPLHVAAERGHMVAMSVLLKAGAHVEAVTNDGLRPLHLAASSRNSIAVALLAVAGADLQAKDHYGRTALQRAAGSKEAVALLRALLYSQVPKTKVPSDEAMQALWKAVLGNDPEGIRDALEFGADVNGRYERYYNGSALELAAYYGHVEVMCVLLKAGANTEVPDSYNDRPLHNTAKSGKAAAVALLVVAGADLYAGGRDGKTPLLGADGRLSTAPILRALGAWR